MKLQKQYLASTIGVCLSLIAGIGALIYGIRYAQYMDLAVILTLVLGAVLGLASFYTKGEVSGWIRLIAVLSTAWGMGLFIVNSYNVWADAFGNLNMYGRMSGDFNFFSSEGGIVPPIILIVLMLVSCIFGIVGTFKGGEEAE